MEGFNLAVLASASFNGTDYPVITLVVDGTVLGSAAISSNNALVYNFGLDSLDPSVSHELSIVYTNHDSSAQLVNVQDLEIGTTVIPSSSPTEQYVSSNGTRAETGQMYFGGQINFNLPAGSIPASAASLTTASTPASSASITPAATSTAPTSVASVPSSTAPAAGTEQLSVMLSEDAWMGDANAVVAVDGTQVFSGNVTALHGSAGQTVALGSFSNTAAHTITVTFTNDAYGGTASTDRNLYVQAVDVNGVATGASASLYSAGTATFQIPAAAAAANPPSTPIATPTTFYVAMDGSDNGDGSAAHPFATLQRAAQAMASSSVKATIVEGGTYNQNLTLDSMDSGESFTVAAGQTATISGMAQASFVTMTGTSKVTLSGFTFSGSTGAAVVLNGATSNVVTDNIFVNDEGGMLLENGADANAVTNNEMNGTSFAGIELKNASNGNTIDSNLIDGVGPIASNTYGGGIYLHGASQNQITHNQVENTNGAGINLSDFDNADTQTQNLNNTVAYNMVLNTNLTSTDSGAIYILGRSLAQTGTVVKMNFIDGTGSASQHSVGIYLDDNASGVTIDGNIVRDVGSDALQIHGGSNNQVAGNIFDLGAGDPAAVLFQASPADQPNPSGLQNNSVTGNIIYTESSNPGAVYVNLNGGSPTISGNDYFSTVGAGLNAWPDTAAQYENPGFANPAAGNYAMTGGSGIGFVGIKQSNIGLAPIGAHPY